MCSNRLVSSVIREMKSLNFISAVDPAGKPALLIVFTIAVIGVVTVGALIIAGATNYSIAIQRSKAIVRLLVKVDCKKSFLSGVRLRWF